MPTVPCQSSLIGNWERYFEFTKNRTPSYLARVTLKHVDFKGSFLDVGAGSMNDSAFALEAGFHRVEAVDGSFHALPYAAELSERFGNRFSFRHSLFSDFDFGIERFDWIHSNFALPYHGSKGFFELLEKIIRAIRVSGVFSGIFFGHNDEYRQNGRDLAYVTKEEIEQSLGGMYIVGLKEIELHAPQENLDRRSLKRWHYFRVIAKKSDDAL